MLGNVRVLSGGLLLAILMLVSPKTSAERRPFFVANVVFKGGETKLNLSDNEPVQVPLRPVFAGWICYIDVTQRVAGGDYMRKITCGGKWGWVDSMVSCGPKHPGHMAGLRLRQPIDGSAAEVDAAEKVTITLGCGYEKL